MKRACSRIPRALSVESRIRFTMPVASSSARETYGTQRKLSFFAQRYRLKPLSKKRCSDASTPSNGSSMPRVAIRHEARFARVVSQAIPFVPQVQARQFYVFAHRAAPTAGGRGGKAGRTPPAVGV